MESVQRQLPKFVGSLVWNLKRLIGIHYNNMPTRPRRQQANPPSQISLNISPEQFKDTVAAQNRAATESLQHPMMRALCGALGVDPDSLAREIASSPLPPVTRSSQPSTSLSDEEEDEDDNDDEGRNEGEEDGESNFPPPGVC